MNNTVFTANVIRIADTKPTYRTGGNGSDGTCDCVGLIIGALGKKYDLHSSNYFARCQMRTLDALLDESQLHEGVIVYKSRRDTAQLNARYQEGGRYYNGDLLDYYHVGVVTSIDPLEITHCTSTNSVNGIAYDASIRGWTHFGELLDVEPLTQEETKGEAIAHEIAIVHSEDGNPVRMRSTPDANGKYNTIAKVPYGAQVEVLEKDGEWATVEWNGLRGYMMEKYLRVIGSTPAKPDESEKSVTITMSRAAAEELYKALGGGL